MFVEILYSELNETKSKQFFKVILLKIVPEWQEREKLQIYDPCLLLKIKAIINCVLSKFVLVVNVLLVKPNVMQKLDRMKNSEPSKHPRRNINHYFTWAVISNAPKSVKTRKNLEASYVALWKSDLDKQKDFERLVLFRNGAT